MLSHLVFYDSWFWQPWLCSFVNNDINKAIHCKLYDDFLSGQLPSDKLTSVPLTGSVIWNYSQETTTITKSGVFSCILISLKEYRYYTLCKLHSIQYVKNLLHCSTLHWYCITLNIKLKPSDHYKDMCRLNPQNSYLRWIIDMQAVNKITLKSFVNAFMHPFKQ